MYLTGTSGTWWLKLSERPARRGGVSSLGYCDSGKETLRAQRCAGVFEETPHVAVGMDCSEDGLASAEIVVELGGYIDPVVRDQEEVGCVLDGTERLGLGDEALELDGVAETQEGFAIGRGFDMA